MFLHPELNTITTGTGGTGLLPRPTMSRSASVNSMDHVTMLDKGHWQSPDSGWDASYVSVFLILLYPTTH